ncbi:hypothetical protein BBP40_011766 [Aspergillus hancockii]|nr:hypothetical protein BBP40_011766 [Aspergillus hancockii]
MARHGRLSKGCQICRKRKIKCDQRLPACSQWLKAGWKCPQYGDTVDRMFQYHDAKDLSKSANTLRVISSTEPCEVLPADIQTILQGAILCTNKSDGNTDSTLLHYSQGIDLPGEIQEPIIDRAVGYFLSTHIFREHGHLRGYFEYLAVYVNDIQHDMKIFTSLSAVALAAYAHTFQYLHLLKAARRYYGRALRLVNTALQCRRETVEDSTLISVLLSNAFEALTSNTHTSLASSDGHMRGVMMVMSIPSYVPLSRRVLYKASDRVPTDLIKLWKHAAGLLHAEDPCWQKEDILIELAELRADIEDHVFANHWAIIDTCLRLDHELSSLTGNMPAKWQFQTFSVEVKPDRVFSRQIHVYPDLWVSSVWNYIRTCRLILHREIQTQLAPVRTLPPSTSQPSLLALGQDSKRNIHEMILAICASIPQHCGQLPEEYGIQYRTAESACLKDARVPEYQLLGGVPIAAGACWALWPLIIAGNATDSLLLRNWIIDRSRHIGRISGFQRALALADTLESGAEISF